MQLHHDKHLQTYIDNLNQILKDYPELQNLTLEQLIINAGWLPQDLCPVLNLDVWEHAYYLKHYNVRADYIKDWFQVVNWNMANQNYSNCVNRYSF